MQNLRAQMNIQELMNLNCEMFDFIEMEMIEKEVIISHYDENEQSGQCPERHSSSWKYSNRNLGDAQ
jgi:hypothetical protein